MEQSNIELLLISKELSNSKSLIELFPLLKVADQSKGAKQGRFNAKIFFLFLNNKQKKICF